MGWLDRFKDQMTASLDRPRVGRGTPAGVNSPAGSGGASKPKQGGGVSLPAQQSQPIRRAPASIRKMPESGSPAQSQTRTISGLRFGMMPIETQVDLAGIVFHSVINAKVNLAQHLYARVAVAQISAASKRVLLLVDRHNLSTDDIQAVCALLATNGYELPDDGPQAYEVSPAYVIALSQGHVDQNSLGIDREILNDKNKSSLWNSFVEIVTWAYINNADDLDFKVDVFSPSSQICFKVGGKYVRPPRFLIPTNTAIEILGIAWQKSSGGTAGLFEIRSEQQAQISMDLPRSTNAPGGARIRLRWSGLPMDRGTVVTMRLQRLGESSRVRSLDSGGYLPDEIAAFKRAIHSEGGAIIFSGVVGSGKSTSLAQLINMLPHDIKIQTFEDPVELEMPWAYQKTITRDVFASGTDPGFLAATRGLYRSALDAFLLGEIRDPETGLVMRQVVESGHSVYTTIHARSALGIVERLVSPAIGVPRDVLASPGILKLLVYQALLPVTCPHCARTVEKHAEATCETDEQFALHEEYFARIKRLYGLGASNFRLRNPDGCPQCVKPDLPELNGFAGRTVVAEMIEPDDEILSYILEGRALDLQRAWRARANLDFHMPDMDGRTAMESAIYKAGQGIIDPRQIEPRFESFETVERRRKVNTTAPSRIRAVVGG